MFLVVILERNMYTYAYVCVCVCLLCESEKEKKYIINLLMRDAYYIHIERGIYIFLICEVYSQQRIEIYDSLK